MLIHVNMKLKFFILFLKLISLKSLKIGKMNTRKKTNALTQVMEIITRTRWEISVITFDATVVDESRRRGRENGTQNLQVSSFS